MLSGISGRLLRVARALLGASRLAVPVLVLLGASAVSLSFGQSSMGAPYSGEKQRVRAPELKGHSGWLNTDEPLSLAGLRGKIILLDFWTYGCVNCIHVIPDLQRLEEKYSRQLVVIGVHSAKFDNEKDTDNIRNIILRYGIGHPVVNDSDFDIWNAYTVNAWPTQVLIDPEGYIVARRSGEGQFEFFDREIGGLVSEYRKNGKLKESGLDLALEKAKVGSLPLSFPGKLLADEKSGLLFVSDSNHNRIVVSDLEGKVGFTIGTGEPGFRDGRFDDAAFRNPQGLALQGTKLYVADTGNHSIRLIDLEGKTVETVAGTGTLNGFNGFGGSGRETALRSPWDLEFADGKLYVAMAGSHQIWRYDPGRGYVEPYAGTRWESRKDGPVKQAHFAQPSGLAAIGDKLYVADSESNIIREIDLKEATVETLAGGDLFDFGDRDGAGDDVRLQHPLAVEAQGDKVLIADTYNDRVKVLDPLKRTVKTLLGSGEEGQADGKSPTFYEPGGLSLAGGKLYIADTNNHAVRVADLKRGTVSTLELKGLAPPEPVVGQQSDSSPNRTLIEPPPVTVEAGVELEVEVRLGLPDGFHLNPSAPNRVFAAFEGGPGGSGKRLSVSAVPFRFSPGAPALRDSLLNVEMTAYYCREDNTGVCYIRTFEWVVPLVTGEAPGEKKIILEGTARAGK